MEKIYKELHKLDGIQGISKHEQFVQGILNAIYNKSLNKGDALPSVNGFIQEFGFARETVSKGYKELINRGIVESKNRIGFFVVSDDINQFLKVALVLFAFDTFQESFYKTLRSRLGKYVQIDVYFHHNNIEIFESIISNVRGKYGMYVIAPIPNKKTAGILKVLPLEKFLMIDRFEKMSGDFSSITQEFEESSYLAFSQLAKTIKKYKKMIYYHRPASDTPIEILNAFTRFSKDFKITAEVHPEYLPGSIEKGKVYFTINNTELWAMLKDCKLKNLQLGKDVGILSHNDDIVKEIICDGITTYSTDFKLMAEKSAEFILTRKKIKEVIPTILIRRNSL